MKNNLFFLLGISLFILIGTEATHGQDVNIQIPLTNLKEGSGFTTEATVLNTRYHTNWRAGAINPTIRSTRGDTYQNSNFGQVSLPSEILRWQLASIGGETPPFRSGDKLPDFKWFNTTNQTWYHPGSTSGRYSAGNVVFRFNILPTLMKSNAFFAGNYTMPITHNYGSNGFYVIEFTPDNFDVVLTVPADVSWYTNNISKYITIESLDDYRNAGTQLALILGTSELFNTVDYNLWAKAASSAIQFTSTKGVSSFRDLSLVELSSTHPNISSTTLSSTFKKINTGNALSVQAGNKYSFPLEAKISRANFKEHFFEAGTYQFQLTIEARGTSNSLSSTLNNNVVLKVLPLSEIYIPANSKVINFEFNTAQKYQQGDSQTILNQMSLSNNENHELYVKSDAPFFKLNGIQSDVPSSTLEITAQGSGLSQVLSTTPQKLIENGNPVLDKNLSIEYRISPTSAQNLVSKEKGSYSINVVYSFTAI